MAISLPFGSGNSGTNDWGDVYGNDAQLVAEFDDRDDTYRTLLSTSTGLNGDVVSATYILSGSLIAALGGGAGVASGGNVFVSSAVPPPLLYFDDADYAVSSKTQKLRVRAQVAVNATQPNVTFTVGLYPVTVAGAADALTFTLGTVVSGSTVAFSAPSASTVSQNNSGDFTIPSDGAYALGVGVSAQLTNNSAVLIYGYLQTRWV